MNYFTYSDQITPNLFKNWCLQSGNTWVSIYSSFFTIADMKQVHSDNLKRAPCCPFAKSEPVREMGQLFVGATHGAKYVGEGQKNNSSDVSFENKWGASQKRVRRAGDSSHAWIPLAATCARVCVVYLRLPADAGATDPANKSRPSQPTHANRAPRAAHPPARPTLGLELAAAHVWLQAPRKKPFPIHSCARYSCSADGGIGQLVSRALLLWTLLAAVISDPSAGDRAH